MIIDECQLVFIQSQAAPPPPRLTARSRAAANRRAAAAPEQPPKSPEKRPAMALHSIEELSLISYVEAMPVMQSTQRTRAPTTMSARPRLGRVRAPVKPIPPRAKDEEPLLNKKPINRRKPLALETEILRVRAPPQSAITYQSLIEKLTTPDNGMKTRALEIANNLVRSEPVLPIHTAIRIVLQATLDLGRPYDTNMLAATFGVTRSLVMQALRKYYEDFTEQSHFTEALFVPTYLWLYGCLEEDHAVERVNKAIELSGAAEPGCRSVFAIARDFVILYVSEVIYGAEGSQTRPELAGLSSVAAVMSSIVVNPEVPPCFLEMTNSFLYRARMTGRLVMRAKTDLIHSKGGTIGGLFIS
jgi:hypothetical protein